MIFVSAYYEEFQTGRGIVHISKLKCPKLTSFVAISTYTSITTRTDVSKKAPGSSNDSMTQLGIT
jgi:hypothetical protein